MSEFDDIRAATGRAEDAYGQLAIENEALRSQIQIKDGRIAELSTELAACREGAWDAEVNPTLSTAQIQAALNDAGDGGRVLFGPGAYAITSTLRPRPGQLLEGLGEAVLDFGRRLAFGFHLRQQSPKPEGVQWSGLLMKGARDAALVPWIGSRISGCAISECGWSAIRGQFEDGRCDVEIADSAFHHNGWDPAALGHGAAGVKFLNGGRGSSAADGLRSFRNVYADNIGNGLWLDQDWRWLVSDRDQFLRNSIKGFFFEVSRGPGSVADYIARDNGQAGLQANGSQQFRFGPGTVGGNARDRGILVNDVLDTRKDQYRYPVENVVIERSKITLEDGDRIIVEEAARAGVTFG